MFLLVPTILKWVIANLEKSALAIVGGIVFIISFWDETGKKYVQDTSSSHKGGVGHAKEILRSKVFTLSIPQDIVPNRIRFLGF